MVEVKTIVAKLADIDFGTFGVGDLAYKMIISFSATVKPLIETIFQILITLLSIVRESIG
ncbi:hypothetical protein BH20ACI3_BH20ACI3_38350 [soil metagenome]